VRARLRLHDYAYRCGSALFVCVLLASAASALLSVDTKLTCPEPNPPPRKVGLPTPIHVRIENEECFAVNVRLSAVLTANGNQSVGSTAIAGPKVVSPNVVVPAGNCAVFPHAPGVYESDLQAPPVVPQSFSGKVAVFVLLTDWNGGAESDTCLLPEPTRGAQLCAGLLGLLILARCEAHRARQRAEK
jgi:hypothetical protein